MWRNESKVDRISCEVLALTFSAILLSGCSVLSSGIGALRANPESEPASSTSPAATSASTSSAAGCDTNKKVEDTDLGDLLYSPIETTSGEVFHAEGVKEDAYDPCKPISLVVLQGTYAQEHIETPVFFINGELDEAVNTSLLVGDQAEVSYPGADTVQVRLNGNKMIIGGSDAVITVKKEAQEFKFERTFENLAESQIPQPGSLDFKATANEYVKSHYAFTFGNGFAENKLYCAVDAASQFSCIGDGTQWKDPATGADVNSFTYHFDTGQGEFSNVADFNSDDYRPVVNPGEITLTPDDGSEIIRINQSETGDKIVERGDKRIVFKIDAVEF